VVVLGDRARRPHVAGGGAQVSQCPRALHVSELGEDEVAGQHLDKPVAEVPVGLREDVVSIASARVVAQVMHVLYEVGAEDLGQQLLPFMAAATGSSANGSGSSPPIPTRSHAAATRPAGRDVRENASRRPRLSAPVAGSRPPSIHPMSPSYARNHPGQVVPSAAASTVSAHCRDLPRSFHRRSQFATASGIHPSTSSRPARPVDGGRRGR
jgi:hypothetical protein